MLSSDVMEEYFGFQAWLSSVLQNQYGGSVVEQHPLVPADDLCGWLPTGPPGFVGWVVYRYLPDPERGMLCWEMGNGDLIPLYTQTPQKPDSDWQFKRRILRLQDGVLK